jgi:hypothetical protein
VLGRGNNPAANMPSFRAEIAAILEAVQSLRAVGDLVLRERAEALRQRLSFDGLDAAATVPSCSSTS